MKTSSKHVWRNLGLLMFLLTPLIAALLLGLIGGTPVTRLDAWGAKWNDEVGYWGSIQTMRTYGGPTGIAGYNEVQPKGAAYGPYNYLTYLPYLVTTFLTGIGSRNYVYYANVLMFIIGLVVFALLTRPTINQYLRLTAAMLTNLIMMRYIWSGMSEGSELFMTLVVIGLALYLYRTLPGNGLYSAALAKQDRCQTPVSTKGWRIHLALVLQVVLILFWGMIRPFIFIYLLLPAVFVVLRGKQLVKYDAAAGDCGAAHGNSHDDAGDRGAAHGNSRDDAHTDKDRSGVSGKRSARIRIAVLLQLLAMSAAAVASLAYYQYLNVNHRAAYFGANVKMHQLLPMIKSGNIAGFIKEVLNIQIVALKVVTDSLTSGKWSGLSIILVIGLAIYLLMAALREHNLHAISLAMSIAALLYIEAVFVLYAPRQSSRMMLTMILALALVICMRPNSTVPANVTSPGDTDDAHAHVTSPEVAATAALWNWDGIFVIALSLALTIMAISKGGTSSFKLPSLTTEESAQAEQTRQTLQQVFEEDLATVASDKVTDAKTASDWHDYYDWDHTVAWLADGGVRGWHKYMMPSTVARNNCTTEYLAQSLREGTLKSRYVFIGMQDAWEEDWMSLCEQAGYEVLWSDEMCTLWHKVK